MAFDSLARLQKTGIHPLPSRCTENSKSSCRSGETISPRGELLLLATENHGCQLIIDDPRKLLCCRPSTVHCHCFLSNCRSSISLLYPNSFISPTTNSHECPNVLLPCAPLFLSLSAQYGTISLKQWFGITPYFTCEQQELSGAMLHACLSIRNSFALLCKHMSGWTS